VLEGQIAHQGADDTGHRALAQTAADDGEQQLVAVVDIAERVDHHHAVPVAVKRDAEVGSLGHDGFTQAQRVPSRRHPG
jgi:hypothetical protein